DRARAEALARRATERLQALQREAERLASEERSLLNDVKKLEVERQLRAEELKRVEADAARVQADLDATSARMAAPEAASLAAARAAAERASAAAQRAAVARNDLIRDIERRRDLNAQLAGELQSAQQRVQAALRDLATGAAANDSVSLPLRPFRGDIPWPVAGTIARRFGRTTSVSGASNGIEIAATEGAEARAVHDGVVAFAGTFS